MTIDQYVLRFFIALFLVCGAIWLARIVADSVSDSFGRRRRYIEHNRIAEAARDKGLKMFRESHRR
jgi:hypothetical protein